MAVHAIQKWCSEHQSDVNLCKAPLIIETDDPKEALQEIAVYLRTVMMERDRAVFKDGELIGYYQTAEWLQGLLDIATDCDRVLSNSQIGS